MLSRQTPTDGHSTEEKLCTSQTSWQENKKVIWDQWLWAKRYYPFPVCFSFTRRHVLLPVRRHNNSFLMTWKATVRTLGLIHQMRVCTDFILTYAHAHTDNYCRVYQYFPKYEHLDGGTNCMRGCWKLLGNRCAY